MNSIKIIGLAALLTLVMAVGASPATAETTVLCAADENPCSVANTVTHVHATTLSESPATLLSSAGNVTCESLLLGDTVAGEYAPLEISGNLTYSNCKRGTEKCTITEKGGSSTIKLLKEGHETAKVTIKTEVEVSCPVFLKCTYSSEGLAGTAKGPLLSTETNGSIAINEQKLKGVGLCSETVSLDITVTPLTKTFIQPPAMQCLRAPNQNGLFADGATNGVCQNQLVALGHLWELIPMLPGTP